MSRARLLKPGFFTNEDLLDLPFEGRLLFAGLWCLADKAGRLEDRPKRIKIELFPADNVDVDALLEALVEKYFVQRYEIDGERYLQIVNFEKHQHPHHREPESTVPAPRGWCESPRPALGQPEASPSVTDNGNGTNTDNGSRITDNGNPEPEAEPTGSGRSPVIVEWENRIGFLSNKDLKELQEFEETLPRDWIMQAIDETAIRAERPSWAYCRPILQSCRDSGRPPRSPPKGPKEGSAKSQVLGRMQAYRQQTGA